MKDNWEDYKKTYRSIQIPDDAIDIQWENIKHRLPRQQKHQPVYYFRYAAVAVVVLMISAGVVNAAQNAKPGETLYSVRQFTDNLGFHVTKPPLPKIEKKQEAVRREPTSTITPTSIPLTPTQSSTEIKRDVQGAHIENKQQENSHSSSNNVVNKQENTIPSNANGSSSSNQSKSGNQGNANNNQGKSDESHGNSDTSHSSGNSGNGSGKNK